MGGACRSLGPICNKNVGTAWFITLQIATLFTLDPISSVYKPITSHKINNFIDWWKLHNKSTSEFHEFFTTCKKGGLREAFKKSKGLDIV